MLIDEGAVAKPGPDVINEDGSKLTGGCSSSRTISGNENEGSVKKAPELLPRRSCSRGGSESGAEAMSSSL